ncbi:hypothetical protein ADICYQ_4409 [Cyclobacterium qasimii M12-11B]|uniref:Uncharacterized protein n=1 Tax=Cyclobacterium qasimii M12-11B TaxID=641524 RepID=S7VAS8_9BACT|nr:hypothetical protein ADICYQ_4409 [Cyclobacterium qasimii M12-11B]
MSSKLTNAEILFPINRQPENGTKEQKTLIYHEVIHSHHATYCVVLIHAALLSTLGKLSG